MDKCKNIWIFNHYAITPDLSGGTRHFDFAKELTKRGCNVTIFASSFIHDIYENKKLKNGENWKIENYEGVDFEKEYATEKIHSVIENCFGT